MTARVIDPETGETVEFKFVRKQPIQAAERPEPLEPATTFADRSETDPRRPLPGTPWPGWDAETTPT